MVGFKHKNTKKIVINSKQTTTLDGKHSDMLDEFNNNNKQLFPSLESEKEELKKKYAKIKKILDLLTSLFPLKLIYLLWT